MRLRLAKYDDGGNGAYFFVLTSRRGKNLINRMGILEEKLAGSIRYALRKLPQEKVTLSGYSFLCPDSVLDIVHKYNEKLRQNSA